MKIISVNVGQPTALQVGNHTVVTGIRKHPVPGRVQVGTLGLAGDHILNRKHHGGPDQAVYFYTREDYDEWEDRLGRKLEAGLFGENVLLGGLESAEVRVGARFTVGQTLLEVTAPRVPCGTLGARMEDAGFKKRFVELNRPGFYTRVLHEGEIGKGDEVTYEPGPDAAPTIGELFSSWYAEQRDAAQLRQWLEHPLSARLRARMESWLAD